MLGFYRVAEPQHLAVCGQHTLHCHGVLGDVCATLLCNLSTTELISCFDVWR